MVSYIQIRQILRDIVAKNGKEVYQNKKSHTNIIELNLGGIR